MAHGVQTLPMKGCSVAVQKDVSCDPGAAQPVLLTGEARTALGRGPSSAPPPCCCSARSSCSSLRHGGRNRGLSGAKQCQTEACLTSARGLGTGVWPDGSPAPAPAAAHRSSSRCRAWKAAASAASLARRSLASCARRSFSAAVRSLWRSASSPWQRQRGRTACVLEWSGYGWNVAKPHFRHAKVMRGWPVTALAAHAAAIYKFPCCNLACLTSSARTAAACWHSVSTSAKSSSAAATWFVATSCAAACTASTSMAAAQGAGSSGPWARQAGRGVRWAGGAAGSPGVTAGRGGPLALPSRRCAHLECAGGRGVGRATGREVPTPSTKRFGALGPLRDSRLHAWIDELPESACRGLFVPAFFAMWPCRRRQAQVRPVLTVNLLQARSKLF